MSPHDDTLTPGTDERKAPESAPAPEEFVAEKLVAEEIAGGAERVAAGLEGPHNVPRPIGPERLRALREQIESGAYPSADDVAGGLFEMFGRGD